MNIIVTGGAGFIGSNFIFYLLGHHPEDRVICLDKLTYAGNLETLAPVMDDPRFRFVRADIADAEAVDRLFEEEKPDIVVNFAAESHVDRSITDPCIFVRTNVMGTQVLMESCRKYGVRRFHHAFGAGGLPLICIIQGRAHATPGQRLHMLLRLCRARPGFSAFMLHGASLLSHLACPKKCAACAGTPFTFSLCRSILDTGMWKEGKDIHETVGVCAG